MSSVFTEITQLSEKDCFHIVERHKTEFTYPLHRHKEFELNFIEHGAGVRRIVGDSVEEISDDLLSSSLLAKSQFASIRKMLSQAEHGLAFPVSAIMKVYSALDTLAVEQEKFVQFLKFLYILYELSLADDVKVLSSSSFANTSRNKESRRVQKVKQYINDHYAEPLRLKDLASLAGMSPVAFSRFFRVRTNRTLSDYIADIRLGFAARMLVDTTRNISEICYECGFNNLSNFNRMFKAKRGSTPREFREMYKKHKVTV